MCRVSWYIVVPGEHVGHSEGSAAKDRVARELGPSSGNSRCAAPRARVVRAPFVKTAPFRANARNAYQRPVPLRVSQPARRAGQRENGVKCV